VGTTGAVGGALAAVRPGGSLRGAESAISEEVQDGVVVASQPLGGYADRRRVEEGLVGEVLPPMLAHKATHEGKTAAEVIAGRKAAFDARAIPSVAYTDPEIAWMGLTESEAKARGIEVRKVSFPWAASGRALGIDRPEGQTKLILDPESGRILGAGIVGPHAGELISELVLAVELGADAEDVALTVHPHPTLSETVGLAAELAHGNITDLYAPKK